MTRRKPYYHFNSLLVKESNKRAEPHELLKTIENISTYEINSTLGLIGKLFVKVPDEKKPNWAELTELITGSPISELANKSSSAVLVIKTASAMIAFTFGYGRHLLDTRFFVHDFGIKTALNTLQHGSLRSVDLVTLDDQAIQKKSQASRESGVSIFGIDISKDILKAVTGSPLESINYKSISGGDAVYSFGVEIDLDELGTVVTQLAEHYNNDSYKQEFAWVDNIRKIKATSEISRLDNELIDNIKSHSSRVVITIPELIQWDHIWGFSFTRSKSNINPTIDISDYYAHLDIEAVSVDSIKRDRLFVFDEEEEQTEYSIYKSIYFEHSQLDKTYILFAGSWYEIDNNFMSRINTTLAQIQISTLSFPEVHTWTEIDKGEEKSKIESEGDYNQRAKKDYNYHLLDKQLIKSNRTTTPIELCDLMTDNKQFIHVKHRKGGSAGLSHLFAQGNISAETLLGDRDFRKAARVKLKRVNNGLQDSVPLDRFNSEGVEIIFLVLGEESSTLKDNLPFFSKVNLTKTFENLTQRGFTVKIAGAGKRQKPSS